MFNRVSVNALLKSVIGLFALGIIVLSGLGAWDSWTKFKIQDRIAHVVDASSPLFTALYNLRADRVFTVGDLQSEKQAGVTPPMRSAREAEMAALKTALAELGNTDAAQNDVDALRRATDKLAALHQESAVALTQPKASRRAGLAKEMQDESTALLELITKLSSYLDNSIKQDDALVGQLMEMKQLAWLARAAEGEAMGALTASLQGRKTTADMLDVLVGNLTRAENTWSLLDIFSAGLNLPARLPEASCARC